MRGVGAMVVFLGLGVGCAEEDPVFSESPAGAVSAEQVTRWDEAHGWGDHAAAGYAKVADLTGYLTTADLADYLTAADLTGYLTSESDPAFAASPAGSLTEDDLAAWDAASGWGDHAEAGYLQAGGDVSAASYALTNGAFVSKTRTFTGSFSEGEGSEASHALITALGTHRSARVTVDFVAYDVNSNTNQRALRVEYLFNRSWDNAPVRVELAKAFDHNVGNTLRVEAVASGNDVVLEIEQTDGFAALTQYFATVTTTYVP